MLYNVLYKCDAGESHNSKGALWWERTLGLPFFANRSGRVTASRGFPGPLSLVFVWSLFWPLVFTQQARVEKIALQKPAYFLVFSRGEKPVKMQESCFKSCHLDQQRDAAPNSRSSPRWWSRLFLPAFLPCASFAPAKLGRANRATRDLTRAIHHLGGGRDFFCPRFYLVRVSPQQNSAE